jgi:signal transduction histidine kinase/ActR/RegA family two-component response regulator
MSDLLAEIDRMFAADAAPADWSGCLSVVLGRLRRWGGVLVFLADEHERVLGVHPPPTGVVRETLRKAVASLARLLAEREFVQTTLRTAEGDSVSVVGARAVIEAEPGVFLGALLDARNVEPSAEALSRHEVLTLAQLAWPVLDRAHQLREAQTRNRHLLAEQETLKRAQAETVAQVLQEREDRLQEKRNHILQLESEVFRRSAALREAMQRAESANRAKSEFLANMSHEIRTPMTAILGFAESLLDPEMQDEERATAIRVIRRNGRHLLAVINDILDLSKIEAGRMEPEFIECSPMKVVADVYALEQLRAESKGLRWDVDVRGLIPETIRTDPTRLRQILINLVGNAIKFTHSGGVQLTLALVPGQPNPDGSEATACLRFDVTDSGIGLSSEQLTTLFEPFTQADSSTTRMYGGTGLGLAISKRLARALGGDLTARSRHGEGSTFSLSINVGTLAGVKMLDAPRVADFLTSEMTPSPNATVPVGEGLLGANILLAEDGPDNQRLIAFVLRKAGAEVTIAENGEVAVAEALRATSHGKPFDLILMDAQMPVVDGYGAARRLREQGYTGPIVALTAHAMAGDREKCLRAGCDDYATKPIDRHALISTIQRHLSTEAKA